jgi:hypothetical protein
VKKDRELEVYVNAMIRHHTSLHSGTTANSGAINDDADIWMQHFTVECKGFNKKNHTVQRDWWKKVTRQANARLKDPVLITCNSEDEVMVHTSLDLFLTLIQKAYGE